MALQFCDRKICGIIKNMQQITDIALFEVIKIAENWILQTFLLCKHLQGKLCNQQKYPLKRSLVKTVTQYYISLFSTAVA